MRIVTTVRDMEKVRREWGGESKVGFVPTMGYLHEGHLSLMRQGRQENDALIASIFVNPTQFAANEDLERYPRDLERDIRILDAAGVDVVFIPAVDDIYPVGYVTYVDLVGPLAEGGEGVFRPRHFRGVATVVLKLFHIVQPHLAYFGQKDAQQVAVISRMVVDLNLPVTLRILSTIREADGLAMSSRNSYLDTQSRAASTVLYRALQAGHRAFEKHAGANAQTVKQAMIDVVVAEPLARLEYVEIRDPVSFLPLEELQAPALLVIVVQVGRARLIDNFLLRADGSWDMGVLVSED